MNKENKNKDGSTKKARIFLKKIKKKSDSRSEDIKEIKTKDNVNISGEDASRKDASEAEKKKKAFDILLENIDAGKYSNETIIPLNEEVSTEEVVDHFNIKAMSRMLTKQTEENEIKKREHKDKVLKNVIRILWFLFITLFLLILTVYGIILWMQINKTPFAPEVISSMLDLLKVYITSVVVEMIALTVIIVQNIFDKTIFNLSNNMINTIKNTLNNKKNDKK